MKIYGNCLNYLTTPPAVCSDIIFIQSYTAYALEGRTGAYKEEIHINRIVFDTEMWSAEVYFVRLTSPSSSSTVKVLKVE